MSVLPHRPGSADSVTRKRIEYYQEIDYTGSNMYTEIMTKKFRRMLTQQQKKMAISQAEKVNHAVKEATSQLEKLVRHASMSQAKITNKLFKEVNAAFE